MKELWTRVKNEITPEKIVVRAIMAWLVSAILFYSRTFIKFNTPEFAQSINIVMYVCFMALFFCFFCGLGALNMFSWMDVYGPMILITVYGTLTVSEDSDVAYVVGIMAVLAIAIFYAVSKTKEFVVIKRTWIVKAIYVIAGGFYLWVVGSITVFRYICYSSPAYDFGIWAQMFHYMKTRFVPVTTVERSRLLSHFAVHFSPIYYLFLPFYMIFPYPATLQILQVVTLVSGIVPVYLLCKRRGLTNSATAAFGILFALFPALATGCYYDLHENCFLTPLILWLFYFIEKDDMRGIVIFSILTMLVKEDAPVYVACIGLYVIFGKSKPVKGAIVTVMAIVYFCVVTSLMKRYGLGIMATRYDNYGSSLFDVIKNFLTNPAYVIRECFKSSKYTFIMYMLMPLGFMPVISKHVSRYILIIPMLLVNLATDYQYQYNIFFQYSFGVIAILFYLAIINYSDFSEKARRFMCAFALCATILIMPVCSLSRTYMYDVYKNSRENIELLDNMVERIPKDASVSASTFLVPHLADRDVLYEYPGYYKHDDFTDYVILDNRNSRITDEVRDELKRKGYVLSESVEKLYEVYKLDK